MSKVMLKKYPQLNWHLHDLALHEQLEKIISKTYFPENCWVFHESWFPKITAFANSRFATLWTSSTFSLPKSPDQPHTQMIQRKKRRLKNTIIKKLDMLHGDMTSCCTKLYPDLCFSRYASLLIQLPFLPSSFFCLFNS